MPSLCPAARACRRRGICPAGPVPRLRACTLRARHGIRSPCLPSALRPAPAEGGASAPPGLCRTCRPVSVRQTETLYHITRKRGTAASGALHSPRLHLFQMRTRPYIDGTCACRRHTSAHSLLFSFPSLPYLLSPPLLPVKCFPAVFGCRRQAYLSCTPRGGEGNLRNMIFPFPFERPTGPPCFKRAERRGADLAPSARVRQIPAAKGSRHISERPLCFSGCAFVPSPGFFRAFRLRHKPFPSLRQLVSSIQNGRPAGARSVFWALSKRPRGE